MAESKIQWTGRSDWNPVRGCTRLSPGCVGCYAEGIAGRFSGFGKAFDGFARMVDHKPRWSGRVEVMWDRIDAPLRWRKPATIFAASMSDLFHEKLPVDAIATIYAVMVASVHVRGHTFQVLTKRSDRMREILNSELFWDQVNAEAGAHVMEWTDPLNRMKGDARATIGEYGPEEPPPGIWLGVSVESSEYINRVRDLYHTPAAMRFLSLEPLLAPVYLDVPIFPDSVGFRGLLITGAPFPMVAWRKLDLVIVGGHSGPKASPTWVENVRSIVTLCQKYDVPVFVKQLGSNVRDRNDAGFDGSDPESWPDMDPFSIEHDLDGTLDGYQGAPVRVHLKDRKGGDMAEWPEDLRVRQMPNERRVTTA